MAFGQTGTLDTFNRANEGPPMTGWTTPAGVGGLIVSGSVCAASTANAFGVYSASPSNANCEGWVTVSTATGAGATVSIFARAKDIGSAATLDAYGVVVTEAATDTWAIRVFTNGVPATLGAGFNQEVSDGDGIGIRCSGSTITAWYRSGSAGSWTQLASRGDSTYSAGYLGLAISDTTGRLDNFGGGGFYEETGAGIAGGVASGADRLNWTDIGAGIAGGLATGVERLSWVETAAGIAGGIASGAESVTATDSGYGLAETESFGADRLSWTDIGDGIAGTETSGADTYTPAGGASYNETGAGVAGAEAYAVDVQALIDSGYSVAGLVPSGDDVLSVFELGAGIIGGIAAGGDVYGGIDFGAGVAGAIAAGLDVAAILESGYGLAGAVASGADSLATAGGASKTDYTRQSGQDVAQSQPGARAQGQNAGQSQNSARGRGSKVA